MHSVIPISSPRNFEISTAVRRTPTDTINNHFALRFNERIGERRGDRSVVQWIDEQQCFGPPVWHRCWPKSGRCKRKKQEPNCIVAGGPWRHSSHFSWEHSCAEGKLSSGWEAPEVITCWHRKDRRGKEARRHRLYPPHPVAKNVAPYWRRCPSSVIDSIKCNTCNRVVYSECASLRAIFSTCKHCETEESDNFVWIILLADTLNLNWRWTRDVYSSFLEVVRPSLHLIPLAQHGPLFIQKEEAKIHVSGRIVIHFSFMVRFQQSASRNVRKWSLFPTNAQNLLINCITIKWSSYFSKGREWEKNGRLFVANHFL